MGSKERSCQAGAVLQRAGRGGGFVVRAGGVRMCLYLRWADVQEGCRVQAGCEGGLSRCSGVGVCGERARVCAGLCVCRRGVRRARPVPVGVERAGKGDELLRGCILWGGGGRAEGQGGSGASSGGSLRLQ